jgi:glyoxylase-like metal-dependent hydrolase (beta-lactamase superfamily II)
MSKPIQLGDTSIHRVLDHVGNGFDPLQFFPTLGQERLDENRSWLEPVYLEKGNGKLRLAIQSYVIKTPKLTILVDTCVGNDKPRPARPFWHMQTGDQYQKALAGAGVTVADIDIVMCTHLHVDHVGWNTKLENGRWVPTFPKAKYLFSGKELAHWTERHKEKPELCPWIGDSVLPIVAAKRELVIKSDLQFADNIKLVPTPGHTIDHFSVRVGASGHDAVIAGDMIHSPIQGRYPEIGVMIDFDGKQAEATRRSLFGGLCETSTLLCTGHFPDEGPCRVHRWDNGFKFKTV